MGQVVLDKPQTITAGLVASSTELRALGHPELSVPVATVPSVRSPTPEVTKNDHDVLGNDAPRDRQPPPVAPCDGRVLGGGAVSGHSRHYKARVREALFMLSRGRCYAPTCPQRVLHGR